VVPEGTATADSTMVEHAVLDLLADEAPLDPENVQLVARSANFGAAVTWAAAGSGRACAAAAPKRPRMQSFVLAIMTNRNILSRTGWWRSQFTRLNFQTVSWSTCYLFYTARVWKMHLATSREIAQPLISGEDTDLFNFIVQADK
jgi:hypothetical protein